MVHFSYSYYRFGGIFTVANAWDYMMSGLFICFSIM